MRKKTTAFVLSFLLLTSSNVFASIQSSKNIFFVKKMFSDFSQKLDINKLNDFYARDFVLVSNHKVYDYAAYKKQQIEIFKTIKNSTIKYDDIFSCGNKVVARMTFKIIGKSGQAYTFYEILIVHIKHNKIDRMWEITYPNWDDKLPTGKD